MRLLLCLSVVAVSAAACTTPEVKTMKPVPHEAALRAPFVELIHAIDARDWAAVRARLADRVTTDYRSLFGGTVVEQDADALVDGWRRLLGPLDATQHLLGPVQVEATADGARLAMHVRAEHIAHGLEGGETWTVVGHYRVTVRGHEVTAIALDSLYQSGNRALLRAAGARAVPISPSGGVECRRVRFSSVGDRLAGDLCLPAARTGPIPGVVVIGSWTTVKEQMAGTYARALAARGFAALTFDPRGHGESAGAPRDVESPSDKIADLNAAAAWLRAHPAVAGHPVGGLGICAGAGYLAGAAAEGAFDAVAMVAPWLHDARRVEAIYGGAQGVAARMTAAAEAREVFERKGEVRYVAAASAEDADAAMYGPFEYYLEPERGAVPSWPNRFAVMAWADWLRFDPHPFAARITAPTMVVSADDAALPDAAKQFASAVAGPGETVWLEGNQFQFYDDPETVEAAVEASAGHFGRHLR